MCLLREVLHALEEGVLQSVEVVEWPKRHDATANRKHRHFLERIGWRLLVIIRVYHRLRRQCIQECPDERLFSLFRHRRQQRVGR